MLFNINHDILILDLNKINQLIIYQYYIFIHRHRGLNRCGNASFIPQWLSNKNTGQCIKII